MKLLQRGTNNGIHLNATELLRVTSYVSTFNEEFHFFFFILMTYPATRFTKKTASKSIEHKKHIKNNIWIYCFLPNPFVIQFS